MKGRPSKLDRDLAQRIVDLVRVGNYIETAAQTCGIHRSTLHRWMQKGESQRKGAHRDFYVAVTKAQAESESRDMMLIAKASTDDWRAAAWRLERKWPRKYGAQLYSSVRQELEEMLGHLARKLNPAAFSQVLKIIQEEDDEGNSTST